jgi:hypothetical protein
MKFYRFLSVGLILCTLMANVGITLAETEMLPFKDVTMDNPNFEAIVALKEKGIIGGYPDGTFKPNQVVNRAEALKMIYGIENLKAWSAVDGAIFGGATVDVPFKDIDQNAWYFEYLQRAMNDGVVKGYSDNTFKPEQTVNTVENLKMLMEHTFLRVDSGALDHQINLYPTFADVSTDEWYNPYVNYARSKNIISADANNKIYPSAGMTRGKLAQAIYNMYKADEKWTNYTVSRDDSKDKYVLMKDIGETFVAELPETVTENEEKDANITKITDKNAYIETCATGFGGYIWYHFCYGNTYRVNLSTGEVLQLDSPLEGIEEQFFQDVSPDEQSTVWTSTSINKIVVYTVGKDEAVHTFDVDKKYTQFGDVKFSPDGKKLAYAAIVGNPDEEFSAVYIIDIATGKQTPVIEDLAGPFNVEQWENNETVLYSDGQFNFGPMGL